MNWWKHLYHRVLFCLPSKTFWTKMGCACIGCYCSTCILGVGLVGCAIFGIVFSFALVEVKSVSCVCGVRSCSSLCSIEKLTMERNWHLKKLRTFNVSVLTNACPVWVRYWSHCNQRGIGQLRFFILEDVPVGYQVDFKLTKRTQDCCALSKFRGSISFWLARIKTNLNCYIDSVRELDSHD